jgi:hypothetical protein
MTKIENGRPFFKKYIPVIKQISGAGWEPVTWASCNSEGVRIERFGSAGNLFFTVRNNSDQFASGIVAIDIQNLALLQDFVYDLLDHACEDKATST